MGKLACCDGGRQETRLGVTQGAFAGHLRDIDVKKSVFHGDPEKPPDELNSEKSRTVSSNEKIPLWSGISL